MKRQFNIADAKRYLSRLVGQVAYGGEEITISRRDKPVARLIPFQVKTSRHIASAKGWLDNDDAFFNSIEGIIKDRSTHTPRSWRNQT